MLFSDLMLCFLNEPCTETFCGPHTRHLQNVVGLCKQSCRELTSACLIGLALSDCISGASGTQHGLNTQERQDRTG